MGYVRYYWTKVKSKVHTGQKSAATGWLSGHVNSSLFNKIQSNDQLLLENQHSINTASIDQCILGGGSGWARWENCTEASIRLHSHLCLLLLSISAVFSTFSDVFLMCLFDVCFFFLPNFLLGRLNNAKTHHEATTCLSAASSLKSIVPKKQCFAFKKSLTISKNRGTKMHWCVP